jgi:hypothetical protein
MWCHSASLIQRTDHVANACGLASVYKRALCFHHIYAGTRNHEHSLDTVQSSSQAFRPRHIAFDDLNGRNLFEPVAPVRRIIIVSPLVFAIWIEWGQEGSIDLLNLGRLGPRKRVNVPAMRSFWLAKPILEADFLLTFVLAIPLWVLGGAVTHQRLSGLPVAA